LQIAREALYYKSNIEVRSRNHFYRGKAIKYLVHILGVSLQS